MQLRGEPGHCSIVTIPNCEEEDAKRPSRERETLVGERTRLINAIKAGGDGETAAPGA